MNRSPEPTHYDVLGISEDASQDQIRQAYRQLVKAAHPDVAGDTARFRRITQAYDVLSDAAQRAAYDRSLRPPAAVARPQPGPAAVARPRRYGRHAFLSIVSLLVGGVVWLVVATARQSVGDDCLVGTWRGDEFDVPFRGSIGGREVAAPLRGGAGVVLVVGRDGTVRADYAGAAPFTGADGTTRIEGAYVGTTLERWQAGDGRVKQTNTDTSKLRFLASINGRPPDQPLAVSVLDRNYPYTCTPTTLELGPYRYTRAIR